MGGRNAFNNNDDFPKKYLRLKMKCFFYIFSILYADIVNFTPLSEQLSASELVQTLNQLFGKFDQIAQVRSIETLCEHYLY